MSDSDWVISGAAMKAIDDATRRYDKRILDKAQELSAILGRRDLCGMRLIALEDVKNAILILGGNADDR